MLARPDWRVRRAYRRRRQESLFLSALLFQTSLFFAILPQKRFGVPPSTRMSLNKTKSTSQEAMTVLANPSIVMNLKLRCTTVSFQQTPGEICARLFALPATLASCPRSSCLLRRLLYLCTWSVLKMTSVYPVRGRRS